MSEVSVIIDEGMCRVRRLVENHTKSTKQTHSANVYVIIEYTTINFHDFVKHVLNLLVPHAGTLKSCQTILAHCRGHALIVFKQKHTVLHHIYVHDGAFYKLTYIIIFLYITLETTRTNNILAE